eukprot:s837_g24.t1
MEEIYPAEVHDPMLEANAPMEAEAVREAALEVTRVEVQPEEVAQTCPGGFDMQDMEPSSAFAVGTEVLEAVEEAPMVEKMTEEIAGGAGAEEPEPSPAAVETEVLEDNEVDAEVAHPAAEKDLKAMSYKELVALAKQRGVRASGKKAEILKRLQRANAKGKAKPAKPAKPAKVKNAGQEVPSPRPMDSVKEVEDTLAAQSQRGGSIDVMPLAELRKACEDLQMPSTGSREALLKRLAMYVNTAATPLSQSQGGGEESQVAAGGPFGWGCWFFSLLVGDRWKSLALGILKMSTDRLSPWRRTGRKANAEHYKGLSPMALVEFPGYDHRGNQQGKILAALSNEEDVTEGKLFMGHVMAVEDGYYDYWVTETSGAYHVDRLIPFHFCSKQANRCGIATRYRDPIHADVFRVVKLDQLEKLQWLTDEHWEQIRANPLVISLGADMGAGGDPPAPVATPKAGLAEALGAGAPGGRRADEGEVGSATSEEEQKRKKKKERKDRRGKKRPAVDFAADEGDLREAINKRAPKEPRLSALDLSSLNKIEKKKKKRRKAKDRSDDDDRRSGSPSSSSSTGSLFPSAALPKGLERLRRVHQKYPGKIASLTLLRMKELVAMTQGRERRRSQRTHCRRWQHPTSSRCSSASTHQGGPYQNDERAVIDYVVSNDPLRALDVLVQRFKALELAHEQQSWAQASQLELILSDQTSAVFRQEVKAAQADGPQRPQRWRPQQPWTGAAVLNCYEADADKAEIRRDLADVLVGQFEKDGTQVTEAILRNGLKLPFQAAIEMQAADHCRGRANQGRAICFGLTRAVKFVNGLMAGMPAMEEFMLEKVMVIREWFDGWDASDGGVYVGKGDGQMTCSIFQESYWDSLDPVAVGRALDGRALYVFADEVNLAEELVDKFGIAGRQEVMLEQGCEEMLRASFKNCASVSLSGVVLKALLLRRPGHLGNMLRLLSCCARKHFRQVPIEILPISLPDDTQDEKEAFRLLSRYVQSAGTEKDELYKNLEVCAHGAGEASWTWVIIAMINFLFCGGGRPLGKTLGDMYTGYEVKKAYKLTWKAIQPHVPQEGEAGRINLADTVRSELKAYVENPELLQIPDDELGETQHSAPVLVESDAEYDVIVHHLVRAGMFEKEVPSETLTVKGEPVVNGLFGVHKS